MKMVLALVGMLTALCSLADDGIPLKWKLPDGALYGYDFLFAVTGTFDRQEVTDLVGGAMYLEMKGRTTVACNNGSETYIVLASPLKFTAGGKDRLESLPNKAEVTHFFGRDVPQPLNPDTSAHRRHGTGTNTYFSFNPLLPLPPKLATNGVVVQKVATVTMDRLLQRVLTGDARYSYKGTTVVDGERCVKYHISCSLESEKGGPGYGDTTSTMDYDCVFAVDAGHFVSVEGRAKVITKMGEGSPMVYKSLQDQKFTLVLDNKKKASSNQPSSAGKEPAGNTPAQPIRERAK